MSPKLFRLIFAIFAAMLMSSTSSGQNAVEENSPYVRSTNREPPPGAIFDIMSVDSKLGLGKVLAKPLTDKAWNIFYKHNHKCISTQLIIYFRHNRAEKLIVSNCNRLIKAADSESDAVYEYEYPIMVSVTNKSVNELSNLSDYWFMYGTGNLMAVTDLNNNGRLELWLDGAICECDGDEERNEPCECAGTSIVEIFDGKLHAYKP